MSDFTARYFKFNECVFLYALNLNIEEHKSNDLFFEFYSFQTSYMFYKNSCKKFNFKENDNKYFYYGCNYFNISDLENSLKDGSIEEITKEEYNLYEII